MPYLTEIAARARASRWERFLCWLLSVDVEPGPGGCLFYRDSDRVVGGGRYPRGLWRRK